MIAILRKQQDSPRYQTASDLRRNLTSPIRTFLANVADLQLSGVRAQPAEFPRDPTTMNQRKRQQPQHSASRSIGIVADLCMRGLRRRHPTSNKSQCIRRLTSELANNQRSGLLEFVSSAALLGAATQMARRGSRSTAPSSQDQCARRAVSFGLHTWSCNAIRRH